MRDASLDEFLATDEGDEEPDDEAGGDGTEAEADSEGAEPGSEPSSGPRERTGGADAAEAEPEGLPPAAEVDPARSTFAWSADGEACAACGERVEERWEAETGLVCPECKEW